MDTALNTFSYDVESALIVVSNAYLASVLDWFAEIQVVHAQMNTKVELPEIVIGCESTTEEVFQTGIWRARCFIKMRADLDLTTLPHVKDMSAACQDIWEIADLTTELTNTGLIVARLVIPEESDTIELGDRYAERTVHGEIIGYSVAGE